MGNKQTDHYSYLRDQLLKHHKKAQKKVWVKHRDTLSKFVNNTKQLAAGSVGALMLLSSPHSPMLPATAQSSVEEKSVEIEERNFLVHDLRSYVPKEVRPLTEQEEASVSGILRREFGIKVYPELEGKRLNRTYGIIGAEQHLARYPGDTMESHFDSEEDARKYWSSGMAPGLGAWRHFAPSRSEMTQKEVDMEKYYIAVPTFLSKDFNSRFAEYRDFYKFRKMLLVNPQNGKAIVTVIGDAGPAEWTGKHLGGSPEVMKYLERVDGRARGPVLYFFIDDPEDKVPLGPIEPMGEENV